MQIEEKQMQKKNYSQEPAKDVTQEDYDPANKLQGNTLATTGISSKNTQAESATTQDQNNVTITSKAVPPPAPKKTSKNIEADSSGVDDLEGKSGDDTDSEEEDDEEDDDVVESRSSSIEDGEEKHTFMRQEPGPEDIDPATGQPRFIVKSKLMMELDEIGDPEGDISDEALENSFEDGASEEEDDDEEEEEDDDADEPSGDEEDGASSPEVNLLVSRRPDGMRTLNHKAIAAAQQSSLALNASTTSRPKNGSDDEEEASEEEEDDDEEEDEDSPQVVKKPALNAAKLKQAAAAPAKPAKQAAVAERQKTIQQPEVKEEVAEEPKRKRRYRRNVVNVACTEYDVIKKVARRVLNARLRHYEEDHEGGMVNGEGNQKLTTDWDMTWHDLTITADFLAKMQPYQKVSQYPGIYQITRKNYLARNLMKMQREFPEDYKFFPKTWIIPQEASDFRNQFVSKVDGKPLPPSKRKTYIVKPEGLSQGQGIYLSRNCERIIRHCTNEGGFVVQEYLDKPHLVDDLKYDLRIYVLLYGINPMRVYIHDKGIARFATEPYVQPKPSNLSNLFMHLTNYAINKHSAAFEQNQGGAASSGSCAASEDEESGHKRSLKAILKLLYNRGADPDRIWAEIKDIVAKTMILGQPYMSHIYRSCQPDDYDNSMCFQVLGFDIMIDKYFKPWLIEVNASPSFATDSALDYDVKKGVIGDAFELLCISQERREEMIEQKQRQMAERILTGKLDKVDPETKKRLRAERLAERHERERHMLRSGGGNAYELIFPSTYEEEKNDHYDILLKRANELWDEFTTGAKGKKREAEAAKEKAQQEAQARKAARVRKDAKKQQAALNQTLEPLRQAGALSRQGSRVQGNGSNARESGAYEDSNGDQIPHRKGETRQSRDTGPSLLVSLASQKSLGPQHLKNASSVQVDSLSKGLKRARDGNATSPSAQPNAELAPNYIAAMTSSQGYGASAGPSRAKAGQRSAFAIKADARTREAPSAQERNRRAGNEPPHNTSGDIAAVNASSMSLTGADPEPARCVGAAARNPHQQRLHALQRNAIEQQQARRRTQLTVQQQSAQLSSETMKANLERSKVQNEHQIVTEASADSNFYLKDGANQRRLLSVTQQKQAATVARTGASGKAQLLTPMTQPSQKQAGLASFDRHRYYVAQAAIAQDSRPSAAAFMGDSEREGRLLATQSFSNHSNSNQGSRSGQRQIGAHFNQGTPAHKNGARGALLPTATLGHKFLQNQELIKQAHLMAPPAPDESIDAQTAERLMQSGAHRGLSTRPSRLSLSKRPDHDDEGPSVFHGLPDFRQKAVSMAFSGIKQPGSRGSKMQEQRGGPTQFYQTDEPNAASSGLPSGSSTIAHSANKVSKKAGLTGENALHQHYTPQQKLTGGAKFQGLIPTPCPGGPAGHFLLAQSAPGTISNGLPQFHDSHGKTLQMQQPLAGNVFVNSAMMSSGPWRGNPAQVSHPASSTDATAKYGSAMAEKGLVGPPVRQSDIKRQPYPTAVVSHGQQAIILDSHCVDLFQSHQMHARQSGTKSKVQDSTMSMFDQHGRFPRAFPTGVNGATNQGNNQLTGQTKSSVSAQAAALAASRSRGRIAQQLPSQQSVQSAQIQNPQHYYPGTSFRVANQTSSGPFHPAQQHNIDEVTYPVQSSLLRGKAAGPANYAQLMMVQPLMTAATGVEPKNQTKQENFRVQDRTKGNRALQQSQSRAGVNYQHNQHMARPTQQAVANQRAGQQVRHYHLDGLTAQRSGIQPRTTGAGSNAKLQEPNVVTNGHVIFNHVGATRQTPSRRGDHATKQH